MSVRSRNENRIYMAEYRKRPGYRERHRARVARWRMQRREDNQQVELAQRTCQ